MGYLVGALNYKLEDCKKLSLLEMEFIIHHHRKVVADQFSSLGKLLGTSFSMDEIKTWDKQETNSQKQQQVVKSNLAIIPLSFALKPEIRDSFVKLAKQSSESLNINAEIKGEVKEGEIYVPLGMIPVEDYKEFLRTKKLPEHIIREYGQKKE